MLLHLAHSPLATEKHLNSAPMDSDEEFIDNGSGGELREHSLSPEPEGTSKRTRSKVAITSLKGSNGGYSWEDEYQRPWEIVNDEGEGEQSLVYLVQQMIEARKKKILKNPTTPFQRGIIRTLIVIIDGSLIMLEKDLRPTRFGAMLNLLGEFVDEFFDQNPISQIGIVMMRNGVAQVVSEVSGLPEHHKDRIRGLKARQHNRIEPKGDPSLQNALELARSLLGSNFGDPSLGSSKNSKEILIIFGALFTSDPGDIHQTINALAQEEIKVKIIGLSAQVAICQEIVAKTNYRSSNQNRSSGLSRHYGVIMNDAHFKELLMDCVEPLAVMKDSQEAKNEDAQGIPIIKMGFPLKHQISSTSNNSTVNPNFPALCACHPTKGSKDSMEVSVISNPVVGSNSSSGVTVGYDCPQCKSRVCQLPIVCPVCGIMLILSTHLARSYHHLVPLIEYSEVPVSSTYESSHCYGCLLQFPLGKEDTQMGASSRYRCKKCSQDFCIDCDVFVHEVLHNCPGCESRAALKA